MRAYSTGRVACGTDRTLTVVGARRRRSLTLVAQEQRRDYKTGHSSTRVAVHPDRALVCVRAPIVHSTSVRVGIVSANSSRVTDLGATQTAVLAWCAVRSATEACSRCRVARGANLIVGARMATFDFIAA